MIAKAPNKHELKTAETRSLLIRAAETIFVRDGYEGAELGEIAALAGRTKGSIYAQFKSKEDIFLVLVDERIQHHRRRMEEAFAKTHSLAENLSALRQFYLERATDDSWSILVLEYRLFALRHPESKKRLKHQEAELVSPKNEARYASILGPAAKKKDAISRVLAIRSLQPMISALVLEAQMDDQLSNTTSMKRVVGTVFDALFGA